VRPALAALDEKPQTQLRQELIGRLRVLVPILFGAAALSGVAAAVLAGVGPGSRWRWVGLLLLGVWMLVTFLGTVPINQAVIGWDPEALPSDWRAAVARWERLDVARCWAAVGSFALLVTAAGRQRRKPRREHPASAAACVAVAEPGDADGGGM